MNAPQPNGSAAALAGQLRTYLPGRDVAQLVADFDAQGFCVIPELLDSEALERQRGALAPGSNRAQRGAMYLREPAPIAFTPCWLRIRYLRS